MRGWSAGAGVAAVLAALGCGGGDLGHRQIAGGPALGITAVGPLSGTISVPSAGGPDLAGQVGLYDPRPREGTWMADRTVPTAPGGGPEAAPDRPWNVRAEIARADGLTWTGACGVPRADPMSTITLMLWGDPDHPTITLIVPLTEDGLATFQGTAAASTPTRFVGRWTLDWCHGAGPGAAQPAGEGVVTVAWRVDPATIHSWPAPRRGAF